MKYRIITFVFCLIALMIHKENNITINRSIIQNDVQYDFNNPNMSDEEYEKYCLDNKIFSANAPSEDTTGRILEYNVPTHLNERFPNYNSWTKYSTNSVSDKYGGEPIEVDEDDEDIQVAKTLANNTNNYIGCGPLALFSELDYLSRFAGYSNLQIKNNSVIKETDTSSNLSLEHTEFTHYKRLLAKEVIENTSTIAGESILGQILGIGEATFTTEDKAYMDSDLLNSSGSYGFIFFSENHEKSNINPSDYELPCRYNNDLLTTPISIREDIINVAYKRVGYVQHYISGNTINDSNYLVLSSKNLNAGEAYIEYKTSKTIKALYFDLAFWSSLEGFSYSTQVEVQYKDSSGEWIFVKDLYNNRSNLLQYPVEHYIPFNNDVNEVRIYNRTTNTGDSNKGRISLGSISIFY